MSRTGTQNNIVLDSKMQSVSPEGPVLHDTQMTDTLYVFYKAQHTDKDRIQNSHLFTQVCVTNPDDEWLWVNQPVLITWWHSSLVPSQSCLICKTFIIGTKQNLSKQTLISALWVLRKKCFWWRGDIYIAKLCLLNSQFHVWLLISKPP